MKQIAFQGGSQGQGFNPIQAGYGGLDRMRERDNQIIGDLKEERNRQEKINSRNISELEQKFSREEQNRKELKKLEDQTYQVRSEAMAMNMATQRRNTQAEIQTSQNELKTWNALAGLSETLGKQLTEYKEKKNEQDMMDGYNEALMNGLPSESVIAQAKGELELQRQGQQTEAIADQFAKRGVDPQVVNNVRSGNKWRDYGRLKAYSEMAGQQYGGWLEQKLSQLGPQAASPEARAAAVSQLQQQYLKENGLFGLSADFLGPMFSKMRASANGVMETARSNDIYNTSQQFFEDARSQLFTSRSPEALNELFHSASTKYDRQGRIAGASAGVEAVFKELGDSNRFTSDTEVEQLLGTTITNNGQSFAERYPGRVRDLMMQRRKGAREMRGLRDAERKEKGKLWQDDSLDYLNGLEDIPAQAIDELIQFGKEQGYDTSRLDVLKFKSAERTDERYYTAEFEEKFRAGSLTLEEINKADVPASVRNKYLDRVSKLQAARNDAPMTAADIKATLKAELKYRLIGDAVVKTADASLIPATAAAFAQYQKAFSDGIKNGLSTADAHKFALEPLRKEIKEESGVWGTRKTLNNTKKVFSDFTPGSEVGAMVTPLTLKKYTENTNLIDKTPILPKERYLNIQQQMKKGAIPSIPSVYMELGRRLKRDPRELLELQMKAADVVVPPRPPSAAETLREVTTDPRFQELLTKPTYQNVNSVILGSDAANGYSSGDSRGKALIAMASRNGWDPQDLAAIFSFETGGTLDPAQPGYGHASGRIGLIQAGPNERSNYGLGSGSWNNEMEAVARYLTARGAKPGMGLEDLYATVNGGRPSEGYKPDKNGTIARSPETMARLMEHRVQASERLGLTKTSTPPTRDPNNMSPTMAHFYTTGEMTNYGKSEHLDVKQWDNPNTVQDEYGGYWEPDELDSYIGFTDPKFGKVTLSELRNLWPIPGGNFGDSRPYGAHRGWDYPTKTGTKLYLQNGARKISTSPVPGNGMRTVIKLPDGRYFAFLHGN